MQHLDPSDSKRGGPLSLHVLATGIGGRPVETLEAPLDQAAMAEWLTSRGYSVVPIGENLRNAVKEGVYVRSDGSLTPQRMVAVIRGVVSALHNVKDEHMPNFSVVDCGFLRVLAIETAEKDGINLHLFMRFTIDNCPAGKRLAEAAKAETISMLKDQGVNEVSVHHGGTPWQSDDSLPTVRTILRVLTSPA